ncbi:hypothetical protein [Devosia psychrophila]|nr:hypothetical protein [Devosia psychrophila]
MALDTKRFTFRGGLEALRDFQTLVAQPDPQIAIGSAIEQAVTEATA